MSEQQIVLEDKKTKKKRWQQIIDAAREALEKNDNTKKGIIKKTAELLEKNGMPLEMICGTISREFHGFASKNYITECLDSKYKDMIQSHTTPRTQPKVETGNVTLPNDDNKTIEQSSTINQTNIPTDIKDIETKELELEKPKETILPAETVEESAVSSGSLPANEQQQQPIEEEELEIIRPEDYTIEDLPKYSTQLKDRIIMYLDEEVKRLTKIVQSK